MIDGQTNFDGIINPDEVLEGTLNIFTDGKLVFLNPDVGVMGGPSPFTDAGPSHAFVDTFNMNNKGTLAIEFSPDDSAGAYTTINANEANLKGTFSAIYGYNLYDDKMFYDNVIDAEDRNGKFTKVVDNSALLKTTLIYDGDDNVDVKVKRQGFGDVKGLTKNQESVGDGIEKVYDKVSGNGDFAQMVENLFMLNEKDYQDALDQLSGAEFAQMAQSLLWSTNILNASVTDRMDCGLNWLPGAGSDGERGYDSCFEPGQFQLWGRITGGWNTNDGDENAPGYDETQQGYYVGADYAFNDKLFMGLAGGYFSSDMDFNKWGGRDGATIDYDGAQIALYGGWDNSKSYLRKIVSFGSYSGESHRDVGIGMSPVDPDGNFDASVVSAYGEVGHRFDVMNNTMLTPFLGLGLASADIDTFTEKDPNGTGAALKVRGTDASSFASTLGVRVNGKWGALTPELSLAWRHEFDQTTQKVHTGFASAPGNATFDVISSDPGADALLVGVGGTYQVNGSSDVMLRYDGTFMSGYDSQNVTARWTSKF
ncbi:autotransporter outer membrane beta-barrel domain-containing protein [Bauldia sp.]|uniref:autotransporter outer membrane beta-barrel domain-containing protein n=1 Tax=Bauldia sp. TaxID=2575872 RepID=UPI003BABEA26